MAPTALTFIIANAPNARAALLAWISHNVQPPKGKAPRPRDPLALVKLVGDIATGQTEDKPPEDGKNANAANLGRLGGAARARAFA